MKCKRATDGRKLNAHLLQAMRPQAIKAVHDGQTVTQVAAAFGLNVRTIFTWLAKYANAGDQALLAKPIPGRPPQMSNEQMRSIFETVLNHTPQQFDLKYGLWTLSLVAQLIDRRFGKSLSLGVVSRIMKLLGFSVRKPLSQAWQQDAAKRRQWETEIYPQIRAQARLVGATVYFVEEATVQSDYEHGTSWGPVGETPGVAVEGRFSLNMLAAVSARGDFRFMVHEGSVTVPVFKEFLTRLMMGATRPVFVIVDGQSAHNSRLVKDYVHGPNVQPRLFCLPA